jgi:exopolysaccharide biosynthesis polyprenyl glycosylphosphotransferase
MDLPRATSPASLPVSDRQLHSVDSASTAERAERREKLLRPARSALAFTVAVLMGDVAAVATAWSAVGFLATGAPPWRFTSTVVLAVAASALVFSVCGLYRPRLVRSGVSPATVVGSNAIAVVVALGAGTSLGLPTPVSWAAVLWLGPSVLVLLIRYTAAGQMRRSRVESQSAPTLIFGTDAAAESLRDMLSAPGSAFTPVGFLAGTVDVERDGAYPIVGTLETLGQAVKATSASSIFVSGPATDTTLMTELLRSARREGVEVRIASLLPDMALSRLSFENLGGHTAITVRPPRRGTGHMVLKRGLDIVGASALLLVTLPLWPVIAVAIRATSKGPALFRQQRITKGGRSFSLLKFRTMVGEGEHLVYPETKDTSVAFFKLQNDPRLTRVGRTLRKYSLDELPQLLNVLRGEMSLVGPRPLPADQVAANLDLLAPRHEVAAGITGWWQINGRSDVDADQAVRLDLHYIDNWSLGLDIRILFRSVGVIIDRNGAY